MVCEVLSYSTEQTDRRRKLESYERAGVRRYWLFDPERPVKVEELVLDKGGRYQVQVLVKAPALWSPALFPEWTLDLGALETRVYRPGDPDPEGIEPR